MLQNLTSKVEKLEEGQKELSGQVSSGVTAIKKQINERTSLAHFKKLAAKGGKQVLPTSGSKPQQLTSSKDWKVEVGQVILGMQYKHGWNMEELVVIKTYRYLLDTKFNPTTELAEPISLQLGARKRIVLPANPIVVKDFMDLCNEKLFGEDGLSFIESQLMGSNVEGRLKGALKPSPEAE